MHVDSDVLHAGVLGLVGRVIGRIERKNGSFTEQEVFVSLQSGVLLCYGLLNKS